MSVQELLAPEYRNNGLVYRKGMDTLDVWFDSGTTWYSVLQKEHFPAHVYLEGSDQHRGWFQSSLLCSVAYHAAPQAPYRTLITHGFVMDEHGRKMSKSLGNIVEPQQIIAKYGSADVLRMWVRVYI